MKIVGVISSPHADGNGAALVREALRGAQEADASVAEVFLRDYRIEFCNDCRVCIKSGRCVVDDDF
jgi:multimeric flavodoxin WrbA